MKSKNKRRATSQLLVHYLNLAEQGDPEAKKMVKKIGKVIFEEDEKTVSAQQDILVTALSRNEKESPTLKSVNKTRKTLLERMNSQFSNGTSDASDRTYRYQFDQKMQINSDIEGGGRNDTLS